MRQMAAAAVLAALFTVSSAGAWAADAPDRSPGALAAEGLEKLLRAFDLFVESIPQYEPPAITEEGDIIIRRKRETDPEPTPPPAPRRGGGITI